MDNTQAKQEFDATAEKYGGEDAYNLAKADGRTVLTYKQWVQVRTPSFKKWFGDWENDITTASVVRNPTTSEPQVVYHGTRPNLSGFTVFDTDNEKGNGSIFKDNHGSFFTDKIEVARTYGEDIYPVFLNIKTPDIYNFNGRLWNDYGLVEGRSQNVMYSKNYSETTTTLAYFAKNKQGIDGATFLNVVDMGFGAVFSDKKAMSNVWVVFNPEQIKSATDNIGTFDRQNPDIRFDLFGLPENDIATIENDLRIAKVLQGEPVAVLNDRLAPHTGMADIRKWANGVFNAWGNHAVNPELGEIVLDNKSVKNTLGHKISPFKVEAIRSIKEVIEQGVVVSSTQVRREEHFFISAPVTIENKEDIVTVLVKRNRDTQRMYLHSVMVKESILQKNFEQENAPEYIDRNADTEVSEPNPKLYSGDIGRILQKYLKVNISELEKELKIMENQQIEQQTTQPESELKNWIEKNGFQYSFSGIDAKVFLHRDNELIRLIVADDNRNIQLVNTSNIYKKISYDWQNTPENFAKLDNDFQTMKDSFKIIANLNEYTADNGGVSLSNHTENTAKLDLSGQPESVLQYIKMANHPFIDDEPYFNALTPEQQVFVRQYLDSMNNESEQNQTVSNNEIHPDEISWRDEIVYLSLRYEEKDGVSIYHDKGLMNRPLNQLSQVELEDRLNIAEYLLSEAMVRTKDRQVWNDLQKQVNEVQNEMEHRKQQEVQLAAANRYEQNAAQNPVFLAEDDNAVVMPFDDFVIAAMKDTGDSREEIIAFANEAFRSQYQAADGYLRAAHDSSTMFNSFDIEIEDKTYYATAPLEWVKEQARATLSDKGWDLENARHNFLHSSLANNEWETAFHQLKAAADDYQQWRNQVCAFFNFRQPEITLQQGEWTQVAQFVNYNQEWEQLDNARLMIAEFTPQQAFEFLGVYQQYQRYVSLAEYNAEQGIDSPELRTQIAALEQSLNEKVAQNLPQTENRQVMFDLFGTQMNLFDEVEKTQEQGTTTPEKNNLDDLDELHIKFTNALEELSPERQAELYPLVRDLGFEFIRLRQDCKELRAGNVEKSLNKIFELQNAIISKRQDYFVKGNDTDLAIEQAEHNHRVLMFVFKTKVGDRDFVEKLNDISFDFYKIIETHYQQTPAGQNDLFKRLDGELSRLNERLAWLRRNLEIEKSFLQQAESGNVAVEVEYHKQTIDSINVGIAKNETEQNKLKLDANGFNQTPESQVLLQQLKEKFPHLWQSETQEQGISASAIPENSQETQPETVSGSLKRQQKTIFRQWAEENGYQPLEFSRDFLSFVYGDKFDTRVRPRPTAIIQDKGGSTCIVEMGRMGDPRPFERFALPMNVDEVRQALDNSETGKIFAQRPKFSKMLNEMPPEMKAALEQIDKAFQEHQKQQGVSASEIPENSQERQPETVSGSPTTQEQGISASENSDTTPNKAKLIENMNLAQLDIEITKTKEKLSKYQAVIDKVSTTQSEKAKAFPLGVGRDGWSKGRAKQAIQEIEKETKQAVEYADAVKNRDDLQNRLNRLEKAKERLNKPQQEQKEQQNKPVSTLKWRQTQKERHTEKEGYTPKKIESGDFAITGSDGLYSLYFQDEKIGTYYKLSEAKTKAEQIKETTKNSSGSPEIEKQGISASEISETVAVSHDLSGQPETQVPVVLTKEEKSQLKDAKDALTVAKKELKAMRDELENTRPHQVSYYLQWKEEKRQAISEKQSEVRERSHQYDELSFAFKTRTGELTDLEKEILTARLSGSLKERFDIAFRELRTQKKEIGVEYDALKLRIENKDFYEFEIQSVMQDAVGFYSGSRGMATLYHKGKPLPLTTDREKAIAYLLQVELPTQLHDELGKPFNALARKISKLDTAERYIENANGALGRYYGITQNDIDPYIDLLEDTENQLMKGSIEERAEINLTYDINTEYGKQKIRELFYNSRHDQAQAELFEKVFAMAQKLNVEVRHALRDPHKTFSKRNATTTTLGWYQLNENSARVKHGGKIDTEEKGEVLLHELVHSVTSRAMLLKEQGHTELLNDAQIKAIDEIEKIYKIVLDKAEELGFEKYQKVTKDDKETFVGDYGLKNSHEFIAELANPVFREKLKQVAMFDDTVKAMTEVATGVEKTETAYDRLTAALYQIMDNYEPDFGAKYEQANYGNIKMNDMNRLPEKENQMEQTTQTAEKGGIFMAEPVLAEKTAEEMKEIINDLLQQRSKQMGNKHLSSDIATLMVYVQTDNPTAEETQAVKDLGVVKNFVENNMQYQKWYAPTPQDEIRRLSENTVKHDMNGLPEKQEQAMKSSQEILAEVMSKYETPIDNKDGLMNRPLHWLSAAELEDRRTVLSCRIDKAIQNSDSKTEERLDLEYINVENEMARRKTLSDNLKEVLESQSETLSVRDFVVLSESFEELLRQINKYDENSVIREVIRQELVAIRARMDGWKQPETLSIDDKLAMTERKLRKINMDIDNRVYDYGADDKTVQNYIAYRTELFGDLETLKEQAATQGGISLDDKNSRHANLFLSATKALLYRDLENAVRWHNHFIEESKEIPVPQSVIDMQTKRIEEYSKELNERLYGDERQKYRDMFPEQIEKIKQDFKKMLENLETSPENSVTQAVDTLSEEEMGAFGFPIAEEERAMAAFDRALNSQTPQEVKQDDFRLPETTEPRLGDKVILQNGVFYPVISRIADEKFSLGRNAPDKDFIDTIKTNGEIPVSVDEYKQIAKMKNELWYCENTKEFVFMGGVENNYVFRNIRNEEYYGLKEFLQQLKDRQPETVKTLNPKEQALEDGKRLNQAAEKVKNAQWECAKKPNDKECYDNLKNALAEQAALNEEIKPRVQAAMDSGKPYITEYTEDGKPLELVVTQSGTLRPALGSYDKEPKHNHLLCTINGEVALNAEQRSTPERVAEVLKDNFNDKNSDISDKLAIINYPAADKVFSENQIKDTLNKALKSSFKEDQLAAIKSPVMRGEWLQSIAANPKATEEIRQAAKNEMAERYGTPEPTVEQSTEKIGVSSPEHEEELATVADDDYERD